MYEDDVVLAFMDIRPVTPGHLLVVPKDHATHLAELPPKTGERIMRIAMDLAAAIRRTDLRSDGINLFLADGAAAGQEVFHVHMHVLPRFAGDGFGLSLRYGPTPQRATLDNHAAAIQAER